MKRRAGRDNPERIGADRPIGNVVLPPTDARGRQNETPRFGRREAERRVRAEPDEAEIARNEVEIDVGAAVHTPEIRGRRRNIGGEPRLRRRVGGESGVERPLARIVDGVKRRGLDRRFRKIRRTRRVGNVGRADRTGEFGFRRDRNARILVGGEGGSRDKRRAKQNET